MSALDRIIDASVETVRASGMTDEVVCMGTVSEVGTNGTLSVVRADSEYVGVRALSGYLRPSVGDVVEMCRTLGGWVCMGRLRTSSAPVFQRGRALTPATATDAWTEVAVTFPVPFLSLPTVVATPESSVDAATTEINFAVAGTTVTGFLLRCRRTTNAGTWLNWMATDA